MVLGGGVSVEFPAPRKSLAMILSGCQTKSLWMKAILYPYTAERRGVQPNTSQLEAVYRLVRQLVVALAIIHPLGDVDH